MQKFYIWFAILYNLNIKCNNQNFFINQTDCSKLWTHSTIEYTEYKRFHQNRMSISVKNFNSFEQINLKCLNISNQVHISQMDLIPEEYLIFDNSLNLNIKNGFIRFAYLKGISLITTTTNMLLFDVSRLIFYYSIFDIYSNGSLFSECTNAFLESQNFYSPFQNTKYLEFSFTVKFKQNTCPLIFKNTLIESLDFYGLSNSFLRQNSLGFTQITFKKSLNSTIKSAFLRFYQGNLDYKLLDKNIFKNLTELTLNGHLLKIDANTFDSMENLFILNLELVEWKQIFYEKYSLWLKKLNRLSYLNKSFNLYFQFAEVYSFPLEDFCLFKKFKYFQFIKSHFILQQQNCSCTKLLLVSNSNNSIEFCLNFKQIETCNFKNLLKNCFKFKASPNSKLKILYQSEVANFISILSLPVFSSIGILTNFINILIISRIQNENKLKNYLFKMMLSNSILNFFYCFINLFHILNACISYSSVFCSSLKQNKNIQYFEIYFVEFLANSIKFLSNILLIGISFERYSILKELSLLNKLKNLEEKSKNILYIFLIILAFILNVDKIFSSHVNAYYFSSDYYDYFGFPEKNLILVETNSIKKPLILKFYYAYFIFYFLLNDVLFVIFLFILDCFMLVKFKSNLKAKRNILLIMIIQKRNSFKRNFNKINKSDRKITVIVLLNFSFLFFLRLVEFGISIYVFREKIHAHICSSLNKVCNNYLELGKVFYLISCCFSIFFYYFLNRNFRISIRNLLHLTWN